MGCEMWSRLTPQKRVQVLRKVGLAPPPPPPPLTPLPPPTELSSEECQGVSVRGGLGVLSASKVCKAAGRGRQGDRIECPGVRSGGGDGIVGDDDGRSETMHRSKYERLRERGGAKMELNVMRERAAQVLCVLVLVTARGVGARACVVGVLEHVCGYESTCVGFFWCIAELV